MAELSEQKKEKFVQAYYLVNKLNRRDSFAIAAFKSQKNRWEEELWDDEIVLNSHTLSISGSSVDIITGALSREYTDIDIPCLGRNITFKRCFYSAYEKSPSMQSERTKKSGLLGIGWVCEYESFCRYKESHITITNIDGSRISFTKQGDNWANDDIHSTVQVVKVDRLKNLIVIMNNRLVYTYLFDGRLIAIKDNNGMGIELHYTGDSAIIEKIISSCGKNINISYKNNKIEQIIDNAGRVIRYSYTGEYLISVVQVNGGKWRLDYDEKNRLSRVTNPLGGMDFAVEYDRRNNPVLFYLHDDFAWSLITDERNKIKKLWMMKCDFETAVNILRGTAEKELNDVEQYTFHYDRSYQIREMIFGGGKIMKFDYDSRGNFISKYVSDTEYTVFEYNNKNQLKRKTFADGSWETWLWTDDGLLEKNSRSNGFEEILEYDKCGNLVMAKTKTGKNITATLLYEYDSKGRVIKKTDANKNSIKYIYETDRSVCPEITIYPNGFELERGYDELSRLIYENNFGVKTHLVYNNMNNPVKITTSEGKAEYLQYDALGKFSESSSTKIKMDIYNKKPFKQDKEFSTLIKESLVYDYTGNIIAKLETSKNDSNLFYFTNYEYDKNQNLIKEVRSGETTERDALPSPQIITTYEYDDRNNLSRIHINSGMDFKFFYKGIDRLVKEIRTINDNAEQNILYEYNHSGMLSAQIELLATEDADLENLNIDTTEISTLALRTEFIYDEQNQLCEIRLYDGSSMEIAYDDTSRRSFSDENSFLRFSQGMPYDSAGITTYLLTGILKKSNELTVSENTDKNCIRDKFGRVIKRSLPDGTHELFDYDLANNIASFTDKNGEVTHYSYNSINKLKAKISEDGTRTVFLYGLNGEISAEKQIQTF